MWTLDRDILRIWQPVQAQKFINRVSTRSPLFVLTVAYTETVQLPGVSGAGVSEALRELTAAADAEILAHGRAFGLPGGVPSNPTGAPGPSIITRAAFDLLPAMPFLCVDAGLKHPPQVPDLLSPAGAGPAASVATGYALGATTQRAEELFQAGLALGQQLGQAHRQDYLILAESVPGGTTTALGVLLGLGLDAERRVSSSMPENSHTLKLAAVEAGFQARQAHKGAWQDNPLAAVAALGDPMQPVVAGMALGASAYCPVLLAGGTQMAAVLALVAALRQLAGTETYFTEADFSNIALATTRWVSSDPTADLAGLAAEIETRFDFAPVPYLAANLDFSLSQYAPMRLYEAGYVKEGVGAGGAALAAMLNRNWSAAELLPSIEAVYRRLVLNEPAL